MEQGFWKSSISSRSPRPRSRRAEGMCYASGSGRCSDSSTAFGGGDHTAWSASRSIRSTACRRPWTAGSWSWAGRPRGARGSILSRFMFAEESPASMRSSCTTASATCSRCWEASPFGPLWSMPPTAIWVLFMWI